MLKSTYPGNVMSKPKQTLEEKAAARVLKKQQQAELEAKWAAEREAAFAAFKAGLPKRLMEVSDWASKLGVVNEVTLTETGPEVKFYNNETGYRIDTILSYNSEEWVVELLEQDLQALQDRKDLAEKRKACAQSAWNTLEEDQKSCIKEYIHYLR